MIAITTFAKLTKSMIIGKYEKLLILYRVMRTMTVIVAKAEVEFIMVPRRY